MIEAAYTPRVKLLADSVRKLDIGELLALREALKGEFDLGDGVAGVREPLDPDSDGDGDAILMVRDSITIDHSNYVSRPPTGWIIEYLIGVGSVPRVTGCEHKTVLEFEIPVKSVWEGFDVMQEADVVLAGYGVHVEKDESKIVNAPWRNTCAEAMQIMDHRAPGRKRSW